MPSIFRLFNLKSFFTWKYCETILHSLYMLSSPKVGSLMSSMEHSSFLCDFQLRLHTQDCGQPGFTLAERKRFGAILKEYVIYMISLYWFLETFVSSTFIFNSSCFYLNYALGENS